jgi:hypothetical protein
LLGLFGCVQMLEFVGTGTQLVLVAGLELVVLGLADEVEAAGQV